MPNDENDGESNKSLEAIHSEAAQQCANTHTHTHVSMDNSNKNLLSSRFLSTSLYDSVYLSMSLSLKACSKIERNAALSDVRICIYIFIYTLDSIDLLENFRKEIKLFVIFRMNITTRPCRKIYIGWKIIQLENMLC